MLRFTCRLCDEQVTGCAEILDHFRVMHPDDYAEGVETWPDGSPVIYDSTLDPADFDLWNPSPEGGSA